MFPLQGLTIIHIASIILINVIYFQIYYHEWFMRLFGLGKAAKQNALFIFSFIFVFLIYQLLSLKRNKSGEEPSKNTKNLTIVILLYFILGSFVIILHEDFGAVKTYLFYLFSPMLVFVSVFGLYRDNENQKTALQILFIIGVILSIYSMMLHWGFLEKYTDVIEPIYKLKEKTVSRFAFSGIAPNTFASMLIPIILIGLYFIKNSKGVFEYIFIGVTLFLFYVLLETLSRAGFVSVFIGMAYFIGRSWSGFKKRTIIIIIMGLIFVIAIQQVFFLRALQTTAAFFPAIVKPVWLQRLFEEKVVAVGLAETGPGRGEVSWGNETRIHMMINSLSLIKNKPVFGYGFTNFVNLQIKSFDGSIDHNFYLRLLAQGGLVVFIPFALFLFLLYNNLHKILTNRPYGDVKSGANSRDMGILLLAGLLAFMVDLNASPGFFHFYWLWFGFTAAWARNCEAERRTAAKLS